MIGWSAIVLGVAGLVACYVYCKKAGVRQRGRRINGAWKCDGCTSSPARLGSYYCGRCVRLTCDPQHRDHYYQESKAK